MTMGPYRFWFKQLCVLGHLLKNSQIVPPCHLTQQSLFLIGIPSTGSEQTYGFHFVVARQPHNNTNHASIMLMS